MPDSFVKEAYSLNDKEGILDFYQKWAWEYDEKLMAQGYISPRDIAGLLASHLEDRSSVILDLGCGTGLTGQEVVSHGFTTMDGLDLSGDMIAVARTREIYRRLIVADLNKPLPLPDRSYDAAISSGTFTHGHVGSGPIPDIVRVLRPGGILACTVHFDLWHTHGFDSTFASLMSQGEIECVALTEGAYYTDGEMEGWFCVYRKKQDPPGGLA